MLLKPCSRHIYVADARLGGWKFFGNGFKAILKTHRHYFLISDAGFRSVGVLTFSQDMGVWSTKFFFLLKMACV